MQEQKKYTTELGVKLVLNGYKGETMASKTIEYVQKIVQEDVEALQKAEQSYGDSWKKRGGVGAYMMLARKWDRMEKQVEELNGYDICRAPAGALQISERKV